MLMSKNYYFDILQAGMNQVKTTNQETELACRSGLDASIVQAYYDDQPISLSAMSSLYKAILSMQQDDLITLNRDQMLRLDLDDA
jgi:hypothetical protein